MNYYYSLPNKVFDYLQAGLPILASRLPEIEKIINHYKVGDFIENHKPESIAFKINEMLNAPSLLEEYKRNCLTAAKELSWLNEKQKLIKVFTNFK